MSVQTKLIGGFCLDKDSCSFLSILPGNERAKILNAMFEFVVNKDGDKMMNLCTEMERSICWKIRDFNSEAQAKFIAARDQRRNANPTGTATRPTPDRPLSPERKRNERESSPHTPYKEKENKKKETPLSQRVREESDLDKKFQEFWMVWPSERRVSKKMALHHFTRIMKEADDPDKTFANIIHAVECEKKSKQWSNPQYIPHPSTWLNQERFNDLIENESNSNTSKAKSIAEEILNRR